jgi:putative ABC transport system permease protein
MGRVFLVWRLVARDLRRRRAETLLLLAISAATATLTLGLVLNGVTQNPYQQTRAATRGPDVVASYLNLGRPKGELPIGLAELNRLARAPGVTGHAGPYPVAWAVLRARGIKTGVMAEGRDLAPAPVDQPELTGGSWVRHGAVVVERSFADALAIRVGDRITLNGRPFQVAGVAVTAANPPYPFATFDTQGGPFVTSDTGLLWLTRADARSLATSALPQSYLINLKLADPAMAPAFARIHNNNSPVFVTSWQAISAEDGRLVATVQRVLLVGTWLLGLLAVASVAVLVGGRMADQTRRVGLLKAVGATPKLVAAVLLAENFLVALAAATAGLVIGWLAAPLLTNPGTGLVGTPGTPSLTVATIAWVAGVALAVAAAATLVPAIHAASISTVRSLADAARAPRRHARLIAASARLPMPLLLGLRLAARRPRRTLLSAASIAITVTTIVAVLTVHAHQLDLGYTGFSALNNPRTDRLDQVLLVLAVMLVILAAVNVVFITMTTALDSRHASALTRALGATPRQVSAGLSAALLLPALAGALVGIPAGTELVSAVSHGSTTTIPPAWWLIAVILGTLLTVAALTAIPASIGGRRPTAEILQSEAA